MITIRTSDARGHADLGWLKSFHTFSFANYYDEQHMHFRALRVINEDFVLPSRGFGSHPHQDMEILTYIVSGELHHKDSMGHEAVIRRGEVQKISAGTGIVHSEYNDSKKEDVHLLQIWMLPNRKGIKPSYQQMSLTDMDKTGLTLFASEAGGKGLIKIEQDINIYRGNMPKGTKAAHAIKDSRYVWLQLIKGQVDVSENKLFAGDAAAVNNETGINIIARQDAEFLLFDLK